MLTTSSDWDGALCIGSGAGCDGCLQGVQPDIPNQRKKKHEKLAISNREIYSVEYNYNIILLCFFGDRVKGIFDERRSFIVMQSK